jgi:predicted transcriptional regulator
MDCNILSSICSRIRGEDDLTLLSAIIVFLKYNSVGRTRLAKELGVSDRRARSIINTLTEEGFVEDQGFKRVSDRIKKLNEIITSIKRGGYHITIIINPGKEIIDLVKDHVVELRDYIVISLNNPYAVEVIGYSRNGALNLPQVPSNYAEHYARILRDIIVDDAVFVVWRHYRRYYSEASLLLAMYNLCTKYIPGRG